MKIELCPCASGKPYGNCCGPFVEGLAHAPAPEALMRSRYTAFCLKNSDYLMATLAPEKRMGQEERLRQELTQTMAAIQWLGLAVIKVGPAGEDRGNVEFAAFFEQAGVFGQLHERSAFIRVGERWFYRDGEILEPVPLPRNQPCVCGSGKKFKRCHGRSL
ncbi:MAG: YchJ family protein [Desulfobacter sp.]|nr:MAG: YchJ family protein [Desulfobacter sp.]